mgnify:CR=1 FL=1
MADNVKEVTDAEFESEVLDAEAPVVVDMWAPWCGPCRMVTPIIEELAEEYGDDVKFCKINVDENTDSAAKFGITSIPSVLFFVDGQEVEDQRVIGARSKQDYKEVIDEVTGQ